MLHPLLRALIAATIALTVTATARADEAVMKKVIAANQPMWVRAPLGASAKMLGAGYDENFSPYDAKGAPHRIYPAKTTTTDINRYDVQFVEIDDALKLKAAANFLFASAGVQSSQERRYVWIQVFHLTKMISLERTGAPKDSAKLVAETLYLGNAFNIIVSGSTSTFTLDVAAKLRNGGDLKVMAAKHSLEVKYVTDGLTLKPDTQVPLIQDPAKIQEAFIEGKPQPIFVSFLPMAELSTEPISWSKATLVPGKYRVTRIRGEVANRKISADHWDILRGRADPMVTAWQDKSTRLVGGLCTATNTEKIDCDPGFVIELVENRLHWFSVVDVDQQDNDAVGKTIPVDLLKIGEPFKPIALQTTDQLTNLSITLEPL